MATQHVKVYEDQRRGGLPLWAWLLPLLLLLTLSAFFLLHREHAGANSAAVANNVASSDATSAAAKTAGLPQLGSVHFSTDQANLTPDDQATLTRAASYMNQHPNVRLRLEGYTDATGTDTHNLTLSQRRAQTVAGFLAGKGVDRSRLTGEGFGPQNPVETNATSAGKADNRRVELFEQQQ